MKRVAWFWREKMDETDKIVVIGFLIAAMVISGGSGYVTAKHQARYARERANECVARMQRYECDAPVVGGRFALGAKP